MRVRPLLVVALLLGACTHRIRVPAQPIDERPVEVAPPAAAASPLFAPDPPEQSRVVEFARDVRPILQARCQPCHFEGGRMYARLPFDRPETIHKLGTKLFTRIKTEEEQRLISDFLAQPH
jgi:hypothetical protein